MENKYSKSTTFYTSQEVAELCKISPRTVMRAIGNGELPAALFGEERCYRILASDFAAWVDRRIEYAASKARSRNGSRGTPYVPGTLPRGAFLPTS